MLFDIFLTLFLVFLNGIFVAAEFAIVKVRSSQIAVQVNSASKRSAQIVTANLDGFLAATQLGITLASLGLGWFGEEVATELILNSFHGLGFKMEEATAHGIAIPVAFVFITILHIVFGELAPKSLALRYPTVTTLKVSTALRIFYFLFSPFIRILNGLANFILRLIGIKPIEDHEEIHSEEELKLLIAESQEGGIIEQSERELIQNVFDFDNCIVKQVMVPRIKISGINVTTSIEDAVQIILQEGYSRYPVFNSTLDHIIGVIYSKDIVKLFMEKSGKPLSAIAKKAYFITENKSISDLLTEFQKMKIQMAVVVSEFGGTLGLVTLEDILEELVGEIQDEHDQEMQIVTRTGNMYQVIATSSLRDMNKYLDDPIKESDDYETLAGLILHQNPAHVHEGAEFFLDGYKIRITRVNNNLPEIVHLKYIKRKETVL